MTTAARRPDPILRIRERLRDPMSLRLWCVIANDGIIATAGILEGFSGAGATDRTLLLAAATATVAGMLGVGGAEWVEASVEREAQLEAIDEERLELAARPDAELADLVAYYEAKGLAPELARAVAEQLTAHDALAAQLESEHGIREVATIGETLFRGISAAVAFGLGALIPLVITLVAPVAIEAWAILGAVAISLTVTSVITARAGGTRLSRTLLRALAVGLGTLLASYAVGRLVF
jgi:VIT1/CCC1 family predicted Fe2+/Mn2+ transporter